MTARHPAAGGDAKAYRREYLAALPVSVRGTVERAYTGKASPRAAIKAHCLICSNSDRTEVTACTVVTCPLHAYRPFQTAPAISRTARASEFSPGTDEAGTPGGAS